MSAYRNVFLKLSAPRSINQFMLFPGDNMMSSTSFEALENLSDYQKLKADGLVEDADATQQLKGRK